MVETAEVEAPVEKQEAAAPVAEEPVTVVDAVAPKRKSNASVPVGGE